MVISVGKRSHISLFALVLLVAHAGCDGLGGGDGEPEDISGSWTGSIENQGVLYPLNLRLAATSTFVTGSFTVNGNGVNHQGSLNGSYADGNANLTLYVDGAEAGTISLRFEDEEASGTATSALPGLSGTVNLST